MWTDNKFEALQERFVRLVLERPESRVSEAHQQSIRAKFANKTLPELQAIVQKLDMREI